MSAKHLLIAKGIALFASAFVFMYWILAPHILPQHFIAAAAFRDTPLPFYMYAISNITTLLLGPGALARTIGYYQTESKFLAACFVCAWSGVWLSNTIGDQGIGGATMAFFWWSLALIWSFLLTGILFAIVTNRLLMARDWTINAYSLAFISPLAVVTLPVWNQYSAMNQNDAMLTAVTMPFAGVLFLANWYIFDVVESRPNKGTRA